MNGDVLLNEVPAAPDYLQARPLECQIWYRLANYLVEHQMLYRSLTAFLGLTVIAIAEAKRRGRADGQDEDWAEALKCLNEWRLTPAALSDPHLNELLEYLAAPVSAPAAGTRSK